MDSKMSGTLYKRIDVWRKVDEDRAVRYLCFQDIERKTFYVQSADFFFSPVSRDQLMSMEAQVIDLLIESEPGERANEYLTLSEAIQAHDEEFAELP
jgi:hypothetical protein